MMRTVLLTLVLLATASSQELEAVICISDTMPGAASPTMMAFDSVRNRLYVGGTNSDCIVAVDGTTGAKVARFPLGATWTVSALCCRPAAGKLYCFSGWYEEMRVVDIAGGTEVKVIPLSSRGLRVLYNPATDRLYSADPDRYTIDVIDCGTDSVLRTIPFDGGADAMCLSQSRAKLYILNRSTGYIAVVDATGDSIVRTISVPDAPFSICSDATGERVYCGAVDRKGLYVIDAAADSVIAHVAKGRALVALCFSPISSKVYCADSARDRVYIFDPESLAFTDSADVDNEPRWILWSSALNQVCTANRDGRSLSVIDCATGNTTTLAVGLTPNGIVGNTDGTKTFFLSGRHNGVALIDSLKRLGPITRFGLAPHSITGDRDGTKVYVGASYSDSLYVIDCATNTYRGTWFDRFDSDILLYNPGQDKLYGAGGTNCVTILDAGPDTLIRQWPYGTYASASCYNPTYDKVYVGGGSPSFLAIYDGLTDGVLAELNLDLHGGDVTSLVCDARTGKVYCSAGNVDGLLVIDGRRNAVIDTVFEVSDEAYATAVDTGARRAYFACFGGSTADVYVVDTDSDSFVGRLEVGSDQAEQLACDQVRHRLYCGGSADTIVVLDCLGDTVLMRAAVGPAGAMLCDASTGRLYVTSGDDTLRVFEGGTLDPLYQVAIGGGTHHMYLDPAGARLYVTSTASSAVYVIRCGVGIAEQPRGVGVAPVAARTVFKGPIRSVSIELEDVLDVGGRRVGVVKAGRPAVLPAGVYFVVTRETGTARRVIVVR